PQVQDHRVVWLRISEKVTLFAVESAIDHISGTGQRFRNLPIQILVILDDEYAHSVPRPIGGGEDIERFRPSWKSAHPSAQGHHDLGAARPLPVLTRNENNNHANGLPATLRLRSLGKRPSLLGGHRLTYRITV